MLLLVALTVAVSVAYLSTAFATTTGRAVAPLDDAYITFQYARQIARGHPYQYNDGDPPTTGMTSPLFGFLMAGVYLLGFTGERIVAFALGSGVLWLALIAWLTYRLASHLIDEDASRWWPLAAAGLVILTGSVQWGCFNGMETGLFTVLTLAALDAFLAGQIGPCALWLGLTGLTRPEGLILAGVLWATFLVTSLLRSRSIQWKQSLLLSAAVLAGFIPSLVNWALTGATAAAGLQAKAWWLNVPAYPEEIARSILLSYRHVILGHFLGWEANWRWFVPPGMLILSLLGWVWLGLRRRWAALAVTLSWFLLGTFSTATLITSTWHMGRYQVPFAPLALALALVGLSALSQWTSRWWRVALLGLMALFLLASSAYSILRFGRAYHRSVSTMTRQQLPIADWLREHLPPSTRVGVHDVGSLRYLGGRPTYDLIGLTTSRAAPPWRNGAGSVFELMEHSPMRPDYFAIYPDAFSIPYLAATDLFAQQLFLVNVPDYGVASAGPVQGVWRADWRLADSGEQFYQPDILAHTGGLTLVDALDVADLDDEAAHDVTWWQETRRPGFPTEVQQLTYRVLPQRKVLDGGRLLTGGISFDITTIPGEPLCLVARLHAHEAGAVQMRVDGNNMGRWAYPPVPGQWLETVFRAPASAVTSSQTRVTLQVDTDAPDFRHYAPYYFWFLQGEPEEPAVEIEHPVNVAFDSDISLLGFDIPEQAWYPGDVLPVTLYWQATAPTTSNAQVFLHLYDADGNLGPQSDSWAYHGTRPPYTWQPGEIVIDPQLLALPAGWPAGQYSLEVGLYDPAGRLPAYLDGVRQFEERVPLATIKVQE